MKNFHPSLSFEDSDTSENKSPRQAVGRELCLCLSQSRTIVNEPCLGSVLADLRI